MRRVSDVPSGFVHIPPMDDRCGSEQHAQGHSRREKGSEDGRPSPLVSLHQTTKDGAFMDPVVCNRCIRLPTIAEKGPTRTGTAYATSSVVLPDYKDGAFMEPVVAKSRSVGNRTNKPKPLPWAAASCRLERMVTVVSMPPPSC